MKNVCHSCMKQVDAAEIQEFEDGTQHHIECNSLVTDLLELDSQ